MTTQTVGIQLQKVDIDLTAGEPLNFTVPVLDDDDVAQDVTGWTGVAEVRQHAAGRLLATLTVAGTSSGMRVTADPADTLLWAAWRSPLARWDLWVTPPAEDSRPLARGRVFARSPISEVLQS